MGRFVFILVVALVAPTVSGQSCSGKVLVHGESDGLVGFVTDGPGSYATNTVCQWTLEAPDPSMRISLSFEQFDTECGVRLFFFFFFFFGCARISDLS